MVCPFLVVGISREDRAGGLVEFGDNVMLMAVARWAEQPFVVCEDAERPDAIRVVGECQQRELQGIVSIDEYVQRMADAVRVAGEMGQSGCMPNHYSFAVCRPKQWPRRR